MEGHIRAELQQRGVEYIAGNHNNYIAQSCYLMNRYGMTPENAVMIGDRDCDLASGRNAGVGSVHLICPIWPETLNCDWRLDDFAQMLEIL